MECATFPACPKLPQRPPRDLELENQPRVSSHIPLSPPAPSPEVKPDLLRHGLNLPCPALSFWNLLTPSRPLDSFTSLLI